MGGKERETKWTFVTHGWKSHNQLSNSANCLIMNATTSNAFLRTAPPTLPSYFLLAIPPICDVGTSFASDWLPSDTPLDDGQGFPASMVWLIGAFSSCNQRLIRTRGRTVLVVELIMEVSTGVCPNLLARGLGGLPTPHSPKQSGKLIFSYSSRYCVFATWS